MNIRKAAGLIANSVRRIYSKEKIYRLFYPKGRQGLLKKW